jgi:glycosyltransferase involved in cell wall biosynthesis
MKIYSYLAAGKTILATDIESHAQVLDESCVKLTRPDPEEMGPALQKLAHDGELRDRLGQAGQRLARSKYSRQTYKEKLLRVYASLGRNEVNSHSQCK